MTSTVDVPNTTGASSAQLPLAIMATITSHSRPRRSAAKPPQTLPIAPTAMAPNAIRSTLPDPACVDVEAARLAPTKAGIHVQNEYSSNMCPRYPPVASRHSSLDATTSRRRRLKGLAAKAYGPSAYVAAINNAAQTAPAEATRITVDGEVPGSACTR